ncbi:Uncharacterized protein SCF082_LOCUS48797 [Durusdinium trenchii]|uniref:Uncharacterized protein n=1 Tax=Durusdinium trenchii TaxID=1381693 RepID=A0ABP0RYK6_9DINO
MLNSEEPDLLEFRRYLDKIGDKRRAPEWTISWNDNWFMDKAASSAAQHLEPGQYKVDRDFVSDPTVEVLKGKLSSSGSCPNFTFAHESRVHKASGLMRGLVGLHDKNIETCPGQYSSCDELTRSRRVCMKSSSAWSMPKGAAQEAVREKRMQVRAPPPGTYKLPSFFDEVDQQRQELAGSRRSKSRPSQWDNEWKTMFRAIHASQIPKKRLSSTL